MFLKIGIAIIAIEAVIGGFFVWQYFAPIALPQSIQISNDIVKDETVGWEIYTNEAFKFELKYPEELPVKYEAIAEAKRGGKNILTLLLGDSPFKVLVVTNALKAAPTPKDGNIIKSKTISVGGASTTEKIFKGVGSEIVSAASFEKNNISYSIWAEITGNKTERLKIFDQLLSTFKILE